MQVSGGSYLHILFCHNSMVLLPLPGAALYPGPSWPCSCSGIPDTLLQAPAPDFDSFPQLH